MLNPHARFASFVVGSSNRLAATAAKAVAESGAASAQDMGKVMAVLKPRIAGRADMGQASALVKQKLSG